MINLKRDHALLEGHVWRAQFGHHHVSITVDVGETPMLFLNRKVTPPLNPKRKKRNRDFIRDYRTFRATILDDIGKILGHEHFGTSTNFRAIEQWKDGVVE